MHRIPKFSQKAHYQTLLYIKTPIIHNSIANSRCESEHKLFIGLQALQAYRQFSKNSQIIMHRIAKFSQKAHYQTLLYIKTPIIHNSIANSRCESKHKLIIGLQALQGYRQFSKNSQIMQNAQNCKIQSKGTLSDSVVHKNTNHS